VVKEQPSAATQSAGVRKVARTDRRAEENGEALGFSLGEVEGQRPTWTKKISRWDEPRVSDEAIVAVTLRDNITRGRAKGLWTGVCTPTTEVPLGRKAAYGSRSGTHVIPLVRFGRSNALRLPIRPGKTAHAGFALKLSTLDRRWQLTASLKPYWGKPDVRNFRGGGGTVLHGLVAICHEARKGGHIGSH
jgi:hypothetical protein